MAYTIGSSTSSPLSLSLSSHSSHERMLLALGPFYLNASWRESTIPLRLESLNLSQGLYDIPFRIQNVEVAV